MADQNPWSEVGRRVRDLRTKKGLSQQMLADKIGVRQNTIASIESGKTARTKHLLALAKALGVSAIELLHGTGARLQPDQVPVVFETWRQVWVEQSVADGPPLEWSCPLHEHKPLSPLAGVPDRLTQYAAFVADNSLNLVVERGSYVIYVPFTPPPPLMDNALVAVEAEKNGLFQPIILLLTRNTDGWRLQPASNVPMYQGVSFLLDSDWRDPKGTHFQLFGVVVGAVRVFNRNLGPFMEGPDPSWFV